MPRCRKCGEPWDLDTLHEAIAEQHADRLERLYLTHYGTTDPYGKHGGRRTWTAAASHAFQAAYERDLFDPMVADFRARGCAAIGWSSPCVPDGNADRVSVLGVIADLMGGDVDGAESAEEDAVALGLF